MYNKQLRSIIVRVGTIVVPIVIFFTTISAMAASVSLRWDPNDPAPQGYRVFARKIDQAYDYSRPDWEGASTSCTVDTLDGQAEYYFVVRAYEGGLESNDSTEAHYIPPVTDNDGDGIPDDWEAHFGLNPRVDDANGDLDRDGISNRDEFRAGLEPDGPGVGAAPLRPESLFPESDTQVERNTQLDAGNFSDTDGDAHIATQWQVYDNGSGDCLMDVVTDRWLNQLQVPLLLLNGDGAYHWRARFFDSGGKVSAWSTMVHFTTQAATNDFDGNGIRDDQEGGLVQAQVTHSLSSPTTNCEPMALVVASKDTVAEIEQMMMIDPAELEIDETTPDRLPSAMLAYKLILYEPGQCALVTIQLSDPASAGARWIKYDEVNGWQDFSDHTQFSADRRSVTVEVKDGGYGDADGVANGIIIDPAGLSTSVDGSSSTATAGGGGGGGCFIVSLYRQEKRTDAGPGPWQWIKDQTSRLLTGMVGH
ncbi:fibronectin type III domain-containing protein [uncultured Desulfosarcina sp.]|uniref:fibronectin type III domain-containing protein n=1 Tax=uncultured Desulfosarcina sp. TaxID=218289 RepID=UPI0029C96D71|nr:fibronectin type III domain-containing protein [uncultured Desulfosarcina sp.]